MAQVFYGPDVVPVSQQTVSTNYRKLTPLTLTSELPSFYLHSSLDS